VGANEGGGHVPHGHVSRHFLGMAPNSIASVPFPAAGPEDSEGRTSHHNILCLAGWNDDLREYQLSIINLNVQKVLGEIAEAPEVSLLSSFVAPKQVTCLDISQGTRGETMVVGGSSDGSLYRLKLTLPHAPGSSPSAIRLDAADIADADLVEFSRPHRHSVSDVRVHESGEVAASVSLDGSLCLTDLSLSTSGSQGSLGGESVDRSRQIIWSESISFTQCAFTRLGGSSIVTGSHQGCCVVWDARASGLSKVRMGKGAYDIEPVTALATHPSKPHVFVCGGGSGLFREYDFRYPEDPVSSERVGRDAITSICYENQGSTIERLRFCTESGCVYKVIQGQGAHLVYEEPRTPLTGICVSPCGGDSQIFCSSGAEGLVYLNMSSKYY
jgi:WD40 repeat protein